jgi:hypothetical protein
VKSLPRGPSERGCDWFAGSRLGYASFGCLLWSDAFVEFKTLLTRAVGKSSALCVATLMHCLEDINWCDYDTIVFFQDGPGQYKSRLLQATLTLEYLSASRAHHIYYEYGAPKHFKGAIDQHFGVMAGVLESHYKKKKTDTIAEVQQVLQAWSDRNSIVNPADPKRTFTEWMPKAWADYTFEQFTLRTMGGMRHSYSFSYHHLDPRRTQLRGRGTDINILTCVNFKNHTMTAAAPIVVCKPELEPRVLVPAAAAAAPPAPSSDDEPDVVPMDCTTRMHEGWRCSFRQPMVDEGAKFEKHLVAGSSWFPEASTPEPVRHRTRAQLAESEAKTRGQQKRRQDSANAYDKAMRPLLQE